MKIDLSTAILVLLQLFSWSLAHELHYTKDEIRQLLNDKPLFYNSLLRIKNTLSGHQ